MNHEPRGYVTKDEAQNANAEMWRKFRKDFQQKPITYGAILVLIALAILVLIFRYDPQWAAPNNNLVSFLTNTATEVLGVIFTIFVVNEFQKRRDLEQLKKELLADVKYGTNGDAIRAINRIRLYDEEYGWYSGQNGLLVKQDLRHSNLENANLHDANLEGAHLRGINLEGADLRRANMEGADLTVANLERGDLRGANLRMASMWRVNLKEAKLEKVNLGGVHLNQANLQGADLMQANLQGADLDATNLQGAHLGGANLQGRTLIRANLQDANLFGSNLQGANLIQANLQGADLREANLQGAFLDNAKFSAKTNLPDRRFYNLEKTEEQMLIYTDPAHPNFWDPCSELARSPLGSPWYCDDAHELTP